MSNKLIQLRVVESTQDGAIRFLILVGNRDKAEVGAANPDTYSALWAAREKRWLEQIFTACELRFGEARWGTRRPPRSLWLRIKAYVFKRPRPSTRESREAFLSGATFLFHRQDEAVPFSRPFGDDGTVLRIWSKRTLEFASPSTAATEQIRALIAAIPDTHVVSWDKAAI